MRTYWDTSAIINAFISADVFDHLDHGEHFTRLHSFAEFFSTMTGRGIPALQDGVIVRSKITPKDCAAWLRTFADKVEIVEPDRKEVLEALDKAQSLGIQGGHVYDYLHAIAARKAKADTVLTRNEDDFKNLVPSVEWP